MTEEQLTARLKALNIVDADLTDKKASVFYIDQLEEVFSYFKTSLAKPTEESGFGDNYVKVKSALEQKSLLIALAKVIYKYIKQALIADLIARGKINDNNKPIVVYKAFKSFKGNFRYGTYYGANIFDDDGTKVNDFFNKFPRAKLARDKCTLYFKKNIKEACERVINDWKEIEKIFAFPQQPDLKFTSLNKIETSGSDSHKQGKQVLFLTFSIKNGPHVIENQKDEFKLVYKPSDLEADCRLIGDSLHLDLVNDKFFKPVTDEVKVGSLMEVINGWIAGLEGTTLKAMPTYKIFPRNYGSSLPNVNQINTSYGYIEFLDKDCIVDMDKEGAEVLIHDFYTIMGQLIAISMTFSISDLHSENLIVHNLKPYIIDLEASLVKNFQQIDQVGFFIPQSPGNASITGTNGKKNRLYALYEGDMTVLLDPKDYDAQIIEGMKGMMDLLRSKVNDPTMKLWFQRLNNTVVRQVPIPTIMFEAAMDSIFSYRNINRNINDELTADLATYFNRLESRAYDEIWKKSVVDFIEKSGQTEQNFRQLADDAIRNFWKNKSFSEPIFFVLNKDYLSTNFMDVDVPVYYHRIGTQNMYGYTGTEIPTTANDYVQQIHSDTFSEIHRVQKYYAYKDAKSPTTKNVKEFQFDKLANQVAFDEKKNSLVAEIKANLNP